MARIKDSVVQKDTVYGGVSPVLDLKYGGQQGYMPRIGFTDSEGKNFEEWISNHSYISRNVIPYVIRAPKFLDYMPEPKKWIDTYKAIVELHPAAITGLASGLTVETDETPVGGAGEQQEEITNVTRARSTINTTYKEKAGKAIGKFFDIVIRYGMMDPDTKKPLVAQFIKNIDDIGGMYTPDFYTGTVLYIEPDATFKVVVDAWMVTNYFPKSNGERTGGRDMKTAGEGKELSIDWASITTNTEAVHIYAQKVLDGLSVLDKVPDTDLVLPANEVDAKVAASSTGFNER